MIRGQLLVVLEGQAASAPCARGQSWAHGDGPREAHLVEEHRAVGGPVFNPVRFGGTTGPAWPCPPATRAMLKIWCTGQRAKKE